MSVSISVVDSWQNLFIQRAPVDVVLSKLRTISHWPEWTAQEIFINHVVKFEVYPPPCGWLKTLVKGIIKDVEDSAEELHDSVAELMVNAASQQSEEQEGAAVFTFPPNHEAVIYTKKIHNQVGMRMWTAGLHMAEFLIKNPEVCAGRSVLELGAGTGCTGVILGKSLLPKEVVMTDFHKEVLHNLQRNIDENQADASPMVCHKLDWFECTAGDCAPFRNSCPVILAADCTYSEDLCDQLLRTLTLLLTPTDGSIQVDTISPNSESQESTGFWIQYLMGLKDESTALCNKSFAIVSQTIRNVETYEYFKNILDSIAASGVLQYEDITEWAMGTTPSSEQYFYYEGRDAVRLYYIFSNQ
mmetsp:Transcript_26285/g.38969  ORF Transcript_26285/g.38969 Transcript_26285/m.38969 type:complete len:358 (-) Transcript_26285:30-1103(-)